MARISIGNGTITGVMEMVLKKLNVKEISADVANISEKLTAFEAVVQDMSAAVIASGAFTAPDGVTIVQFQDLSKNVTTLEEQIAGLSENGVGSGDSSKMTAFFEAMTQQPKKFIFDASSNTTNVIDISWNVDNSGGTLDWALASSGLSIQHIDSIVLQIRNHVGSSSWNTHSSDIGSSTTTYPFNLGTTYGTIPLTASSTIDVRLYGVNQAQEDAGGSINDRALEIIGLTFKGAGAPIRPTATFTTPSNTSTINITVDCSDVDIDDPETSTLKIEAYDISYNSYETYRDYDWNGTTDLFNTNQLTKTNNSFGPYSQSQIDSGQLINLTENINPGTSYKFQIRLKNDSSIKWSDLSSIYTTAKTKLPNAILSSPSTIGDCFDVNQSLATVPNTFYDGNADVSGNVTIYYTNKAANTDILTFNNDPVSFEITDPSEDPEANTNYGARIMDSSENLATLTVSSASAKMNIGDAIHFRKNSTNVTNTNYFSNLSSNDPKSGEEAGFRRQGEFRLKDITTSYFDPSSNPHTITYVLDGSTNSAIYETTSYTFYVDDLSACTCSFSGISESSPTDFKYNCGIPSVKMFKITTGVIGLTNMNSQYKFLPTGNIVDVSGGGGDVSLFYLADESVTHSEFTINDTGDYDLSAQIISDINFTTSHLLSTVIPINAAATNLRGTSSSVSNDVSLNMFCDYNSFKNESDEITTTTICPAFYELNDPADLSGNLYSTPFFVLYNGDHKQEIKDSTPLFCNGEFATFTKGGSHYIDYSIFDASNGQQLGGPNYSNMDVAYLKNGDASSNGGYKWIGFDASGTTVAVHELYDAIDISGVTGSTNLRGSDSNVVVYIRHGGFWGNLKADFNSNDAWYSKAESGGLSDIEVGVWNSSRDSGSEIELDPEEDGPVHFLIGLKNSASLSLKK